MVFNWQENNKSFIGYCRVDFYPDQEIIQLLITVARRQILARYQSECGKHAAYAKIHSTVTCYPVANDLLQYPWNQDGHPLPLHQGSLPYCFPSDFYILQYIVVGLSFELD